MNNAFISYSRRDIEFVRKLVEAFKADGRDVWVDWEDIPLTADWMSEIHEGIEGADDFIFIISPDSVASEVATQELAHALKLNKRLVPLLYREVTDYREIHKSLASHNWIMFNRPEEFDQAFRNLLNALDSDLEYTRAHTRLTQRSLEWEKRNRNPSLLLRGQDLIEYEHLLSQSSEKYPRITPLQTEYVFTSRRRAARVQRLLIAALMLGFIVSVILSLFAIGSRNEAQIARNDAQTQAARAEQSAGTATVAQGLAEEAAILADARAADVQSLLLADNANQIVPEAPELAIVLALEANRSISAPAQSQRVLAEIGYAPGVKRVFSGFKAAVNSVSISPNRQRVVSGSDDGSIIVWDVNNGARLFQANEQALPVKSVAFSHDGKLVATGMLNGSIVVWDLTTGEVAYRLGGIRTRTGHTATVSAVLFTPDDRQIVSGGADNVIIVWDLSTSTEIARMGSSNSHITALALSPDGTKLYAGLESSQINVEIWDMTTFTRLKSLKKHGSAVRALALNTLGTLAVSSSDNNDLVIWNALTGDTIRPLGEAFGTYRIVSVITGVAYTPDSASVITSSRDGRLLVWDTSNGKGVRSLTSSSAPLLALAASPDGRSILTGSDAADQSSLTLWDIDNGAVRGYLEGHQDSINAVTYSPDGSQVATVADDGFVNIWDAQNFDILQVIEGHSDQVRDVAYNVDGSILATGGDDGNIILSDPHTGEELNRISVGDARVNSLMFVPGSKNALITGLDDSRLILWNTTDGTQVREFTGHTRRVMSMAISPDGQWMVSGSAGGQLIKWDISTGENLRELQGQTGRVTSISWSPNGAYIVTGADDGQILLWDITVGTIVRAFESESSSIYSVRFSPNGRYVLSGEAEGSIRLWDVSTGEAVRVFEHTSSAPVTGVAFSPDSQYAVSVSRDKIGIMWRMPSLEGLIQWVRTNRYVPDLTCRQKLFYRIVSDCPQPGVTVSENTTQTDTR